MLEPHFAPHGHFLVQWCGDVLFSRWVGTFNNESVANYVDDVKRHARERQAARWGRIVDLRAWEGMTPDVVSQFDELAKWLRTTSCIVSVQVFSESFYQKIAARVADRVSAPNLTCVFDMDSAVDVMKGCGLDVGDWHKLLLT